MIRIYLSSQRIWNYALMYLQSTSLTHGHSSLYLRTGTCIHFELPLLQLLCTQFVYNVWKHFNVPSLCRMLAYIYVHAFYTDLVWSLIFLKKNPIWNFFIPNLCRMLAHTYVQAFYKDWVECVYPICVECLHIVISTQIGYINFGILHKLGTFLNFKKCPQFV